MADAIRAKEILEVGDMEKIRVRVDGVTIHNRSLKVELPEYPGKFYSAEVRDPAFDQTPNIYTAAIGQFLDVEAKPTRRPNGDLVKLYIMNAA